MLVTLIFALLLVTVFFKDNWTITAGQWEWRTAPIMPVNPVLHEPIGTAYLLGPLTIIRYY
jgi:hypothetical protein